MRTLLVTALLVAVATPAFAKPPARPEPPPTTTSASPAPPGITPQKRAEAFKPYDDAMASGQKGAAGDALQVILDDPTLQPIHGEAWVKMGDLLASFDMEYSALIAYTNAIQADPQTAASKVGAAMDLAEKMGDTSLLAPALAANVGIDVDKDTRSRMAFLAARHYFQTGEYGTAQGILMMVDKDSKVFPRSEALRGIVLAQQGKAQEALAPLVTAEATMDRLDKKDQQRFRNVVDLNLGRAYFAAENFPRAIEYYAKVDRESEFWPDATFERAWAHFRLTDMNGSLGLLENFRTPFLQDFYYPEADMLRVYSLFLLCKFPSASQDIDAFVARYTPIEDELDRDSSTSPQDAWDDVVAYTKGKPTKLPSMVLRAYKTEDRIQGAIATVAKADDEILRLKNSAANPFTQKATTALQARRDEIVKTEGARVVAQVQSDRDELKQMLANTQVTKLDMMQFETKLLEQASATGKMAAPEKFADLRKQKRAKGTLVWPNEGEYWADEVGYYKYDVHPDCPEDMQAGKPQ